MVPPGGLFVNYYLTSLLQKYLQDNWNHEMNPWYYSSLLEREDFVKKPSLYLDISTDFLFQRVRELCSRHHAVL